MSDTHSACKLTRMADTTAEAKMENAKAAATPVEVASASIDRTSEPSSGVSDTKQTPSRSVPASPSPSASPAGHHSSSKSSSVSSSGNTTKSCAASTTTPSTSSDNGCTSPKAKRPQPHSPGRSKQDLSSPTVPTVASATGVTHPAHPAEVKTTTTSPLDPVPQRLHGTLSSLPSPTALPVQGSHPATRSPSQQLDALPSRQASLKMQTARRQQRMNTPRQSAVSPTGNASLDLSGLPRSTPDANADMPTTARTPSPPHTTTAQPTGQSSSTTQSARGILESTLCQSFPSQYDSGLFTVDNQQQDLAHQVGQQQQHQQVLEQRQQELELRQQQHQREAEHHQKLWHDNMSRVDKELQRLEEELQRRNEQLQRQNSDLVRNLSGIRKYLSNTNANAAKESKKTSQRLDRLDRQWQDHKERWDSQAEVMAAHLRRVQQESKATRQKQLESDQAVINLQREMRASNRAQNQRLDEKVRQQQQLCHQQERTGRQLHQINQALRNLQEQAQLPRPPSSTPSVNQTRTMSATLTCQAPHGTPRRTPTTTTQSPAAVGPANITLTHQAAARLPSPPSSPAKVNQLTPQKPPPPAVTDATPPPAAEHTKASTENNTTLTCNNNWPPPGGSSRQPDGSSMSFRKSFSSFGDGRAPLGVDADSITVSPVRDITDCDTSGSDHKHSGAASAGTPPPYTNTGTTPLSGSGAHRSAHAHVPPDTDKGVAGREQLSDQDVRRYDYGPRFGGQRFQPDGARPQGSGRADTKVGTLDDRIRKAQLDDLTRFKLRDGDNVRDFLQHWQARADTLNLTNLQKGKILDMAPTNPSLQQMVALQMSFADKCAVLLAQEPRHSTNTKVQHFLSTKRKPGEAVPMFANRLRLAFANLCSQCGPLPPLLLNAAFLDGVGAELAKRTSAQVKMHITDREPVLNDFVHFARVLAETHPDIARVATPSALLASVRADATPTGHSSLPTPPFTAAGQVHEHGLVAAVQDMICRTCGGRGHGWRQCPSAHPHAYHELEQKQDRQRQGAYADSRAFRRRRYSGGQQRRPRRFQRTGSPPQSAAPSFRPPREPATAAAATFVQQASRASAASANPADTDAAPSKDVTRCQHCGIRGHTRGTCRSFIRSLRADGLGLVSLTAEQQGQQHELPRVNHLAHAGLADHDHAGVEPQRAPTPPPAQWSTPSTPEHPSDAEYETPGVTDILDDEYDDAFPATDTLQGRVCMLTAAYGDIERKCESPSATTTNRPASPTIFWAEDDTEPTIAAATYDGTSLGDDARGADSDASDPLSVACPHGCPLYATVAASVGNARVVVALDSYAAYSVMHSDTLARLQRDAGFTIHVQRLRRPVTFKGAAPPTYGGPVPVITAQARCTLPISVVGFGTRATIHMRFLVSNVAIPTLIVSQRAMCNHGINIVSTMGCARFGTTLVPFVRTCPHAARTAADTDHVAHVRGNSAMRASPADLFPDAHSTVDDHTGGVREHNRAVETGVGTSHADAPTGPSVSVFPATSGAPRVTVTGLNDDSITPASDTRRQQQPAAEPPEPQDKPPPRGWDIPFNAHMRRAQELIQQIRQVMDELNTPSPEGTENSPAATHAHLRSVAGRHTAALRRELRRVRQILQQVSVGPHLTPAQRDDIYQLVCRFNQQFYLNGDPLTTTTAGMHRIRTGDKPPSFVPMRRVSPQHRKIIEAAVKELLRLNVIEPSISAYNSALHCVLKPNGEGRVVLDARALNRLVEADRFPLPRLEEALEWIGDKPYRSSLDCRKWFWQIALDPRDRHKTSFMTPCGTYRYRKTPMGMLNSSSTAQRLMHIILSGMMRRNAFAYIDDIWLADRTWQEHIATLHQAFSRFERFNVQISTKKTVFCTQQLDMLGVRLSPDGYEPLPRNLASIKEYPRPATQTQLRRFLGLANFYRTHIPHYSHLTAPLDALLRKDATFQWSTQCEQAFRRIKELLVSSPVLAYPDFTRPFELHTDASAAGLGAVLLQHKDGQPVAIAYISRRLTAAEQKNDSATLEFLACHWAMRCFRPYLIGAPFLLRGDCKRFASMMKATAPAKIQRWACLMSEFPFTWKHKAGKHHVVPDALSRAPTGAPRPEPLQPGTVVVHDADAPHIAAITRSQRRKQRKAARPAPPLASPTSTPVQAPPPPTFVRTTTPSVAASSPAPPSASLAAPRLPTPSQPDQIVGVGDAFTLSAPKTTYTPPDLALLAAQQRADAYFGPLYADIQQRDSGRRTFAARRRRQLQWFLLEDGVLKRIAAPLSDSPWLQFCIPSCRTTELVKAAHDTYTAHLGRYKTYQALRQAYWWPGMYRQVKRHVRTCDACQRSKATPLRTFGFFRQRHVARFGDIWAVDYVGPLPLTPRGFRYICHFMCLATSWSELVPTPTATAEDFAKAFITRIICRFGVPTCIRVDRAQAFTGKLAQAITAILGVRLGINVAYSPQSNAQIERAHRFMGTFLRANLGDDVALWDELVPPCEWALRCSVSEDTGYSSAHLVLGHQPRGIAAGILSSPPKIIPTADQLLRRLITAVQRARTNAAARRARTVERRRASAHRGRKPFPPLPLGSLVLLHMPALEKRPAAKLLHSFAGPYRTISEVSHNSVKIQHLLSGSTDRVHRRRVVRYYGPAPPLAPPPADQTQDHPSSARKRVTFHPQQHGDAPAAPLRAADARKRTVSAPPPCPGAAAPERPAVGEFIFVRDPNHPRSRFFLAQVHRLEADGRVDIRYYNTYDKGTLHRRRHYPCWWQPATSTTPGVEYFARTAEHPSTDQPMHHTVSPTDIVHRNVPLDVDGRVPQTAWATARANLK